MPALGGLTLTPLVASFMPSKLLTVRALLPRRGGTRSDFQWWLQPPLHPDSESGPGIWTRVCLLWCARLGAVTVLLPLAIAQLSVTARIQWHRLD